MASLAEIASHCKELISLNLRFVLDLDDDAVLMLVTKLPQLEELDLGYDMLLTPEALTHVGKLHHIRSLGLNEVFLIEAGHVQKFKTEHPGCVIPDRE